MLFVNVCFVVCVFGDLEHKNIFALTGKHFGSSPVVSYKLLKNDFILITTVQRHTKKRYCIFTILTCVDY